MNRQLKTAIAVAAIAGLVLGACSRGGSSSGERADGGSSSDIAEVCAGAPLEATEIGVSASEITITVMADVGSPLQPGLFQANVDAMNAYAAMVNAEGGVGCRQLKVRVWDTRLDPTEAKNGLIDACGDSLALVGGSVLFNPDPSPMANCVDKAGEPVGLPDMPGLATDINQLCNRTTYTIQGSGETCEVTVGSRSVSAMVGPTLWYQKNLESELHGIFLVPGDLPSVVQASTSLIAAQGDAGIVWDGTPKVSGRDTQAAYTPRIQIAKDAESNVVYGGSNDRSMWTMRKEAQAQQLSTVKVWACSLSCYTRDFLKVGGADVEGTYLWVPFLPFEEADTNAAEAAYVSAMGGVEKASAQGAQAWQAALLFTHVVDSIVKAQGPNAITRSALLDGLAATTDFTADGWSSLKNKQGFSSCFVLMKVENGHFVRVFPAEKGTLDCSSTNVVSVTLDPAEAAKKIS
jgi:ABC-type branched-subunit amino acid transport system substrate-binding protein